MRCAQVWKQFRKSLCLILDVYHWPILWTVFTGHRIENTLKVYAWFVKKMHKHVLDFNRTQKIAYLLLEDGSVFPGRHFGAERPVDGEIGECTSNTCSSIAFTHVHGCFLRDITLSAVIFLFCIYTFDFNLISMIVVPFNWAILKRMLE